MVPLKTSICKFADSSNSQPLSFAMVALLSLVSVDCALRGEADASRGSDGSDQLTVAPLRGSL